MTPVLESDVLVRIREQAAQRFAQLGWPTPRLEEWKYTSLQALQSRVDRGELVVRETPAATGAHPGPYTLRGRALAELVFVDGILDEKASDFGSRAAGVSVATFATARAECLETHLARYADYENHAMTALNTANAVDGAVLEIEAAAEGFVHLLFVGTAGHRSHPRNLIVVGRGAQIAVVETYAGEGAYFVNPVTEIVAREGAVADHYRISCDSAEAYHVGTVHVHAERAANVTARSVTLGGALVRTDTNAALTGEGASLVLDGLYVGAARQHIDNHTVIEHASPHCDSIESYKGILDGEARGVFDGTIIVRPGAQKTVSRQTNKNLLLSETAVVDSKPTLVISNDDVKCNHGSTIGQLDDEALFYLRSRGLGEEEGRALLVYAFASEIVERMKVEAVREQIRRMMFRHIPERMPERRGGSR